MLKSLFGGNKTVPPPEPAPEAEPSSAGKVSLLDRLKQGIQKTRTGLVEAIEDTIQGRKEIDADLLEELEYKLVAADLGIRTTTEILERIRQRVDRKLVNDAGQLKHLIGEYLLEILQATERPWRLPAEGPAVLMIVGVNGVGKTTTIGKLATLYQSQGKSVLMCAADTFRAAAIEQLEVWGERAKTEVIRQQQGSDPSAVLFDALQAARARKTDYVIVDTAGRLHTKNNLMSELEKMSRTAARVIEGAPHEVLLVMDATTGQNGLEQARKFTESSGVTGIILTKLDGTAKGGVVVAIARELGLPVRYIGVGEQVADLLPFEPENFIRSLFD
jgi:fused signal recognition particle receptor